MAKNPSLTKIISTYLMSFLNIQLSLLLFPSLIDIALSYQLMLTFVSVIYYFHSIFHQFALLTFNLGIKSLQLIFSAFI